MNIEVALAGRWAQQAADRLLARVLQQPDLTLCLAAGATPRPLYARVAAAVAAGEVSFAGVRVFLLDEFGGLPPDDPARCASMLTADLLDHIDVDPARVHAPDVDGGNLGSVCADLEAAIAAAGGLDLALLGLGANGHIGMNEPGADPASRTQVCLLHPSTQANASGYGATTTPTWGVTLGLGTLLEAHEVWLLVTGEHKREILARTLDGPITADVPASLLRRHERCFVLADDAAAGGRDHPSG